MTERLIGSTRLAEPSRQGKAEEQAVLVPDESNGDSGTESTLPKRGVLFIRYLTDKGNKRSLSIDPVKLEPGEDGGVVVGNSHFRVKPGNPETLVPTEPKMGEIRALVNGTDHLDVLDARWSAVRRVLPAQRFVADNRELLGNLLNDHSKVTRLEVRTGPRPHKRT